MRNYFLIPTTVSYVGIPLNFQRLSLKKTAFEMSGVLAMPHIALSGLFSHVAKRVSVWFACAAYTWGSSHFGISLISCDF